MTGDTVDVPDATPRRHDIIVSRRTARILVVVAVVLAVAVAIMATKATLMLVAGGALALLLSFPLAWLSRIMPRHLAVAVLLGMVVLLLALAGYLLLPILAIQAGNIVRDLPTLVATANAQLDALVDGLARRGLAPEASGRIIATVQDGVVARLGVFVGGLASGAIGWAQAVAGILIGTLGALFIAVYLLIEAPQLRARFVAAMPERYRADAADLWMAAADQLSRYFASMVTIAVIQAVAASIFLSLLGVPYALLLGTWIGLTSTIPYIGTWFGGIPAIAVASLESPLRGLAVLALFFIVTTVIGNAITPRIQGAAVKVHPILVLVAVVAAGEVFGLLGLFLAVPALAIGRVLVDFLSVRLRVEAAPPPV